MNKTMLLAAGAVLALTGAASAAGHIAPAGHGVVKAFPRSGLDRSSGVLYDQHGTDSGIGIVSQNFESTYDAYDAAAADDFTVGKKWKVSEVDVTGVYFNGSGPARDETVTFYKDSGGLPGAAVNSQTVAGSDSGGSFNIPLKSVKLKAGTYWVSVYANMDFGAGGEWGWENQLSVVGNPAAWQNPGGGFGIGCTSWTTETSCIPDGQGDHEFTIKGKGK
jgi:hypothetical protein